MAKSECVICNKLPTGMAMVCSCGHVICLACSQTHSSAEIKAVLAKLHEGG